MPQSSLFPGHVPRRPGISISVAAAEKIRTGPRGEIRAVGEPATVKAMAFIRFASSMMEFCAALFMLHFARVDTAVNINAALGLVGPVIFISITALGVAGLAGQVSPAKLLLVVAGVVLIFIGTRG